VRQPKTEAAIAKAFRDARGSYVSGESLASSIGISRAAIWKHIKALREKGYEIEASTKLGYRIVSAPDRMFVEEIAPLLTTQSFGRRIIYFSSVGSTNSEAKALAAKGACEGTLVVAEEQVNGKGRLDRLWVSPEGGIWLSIVLRPHLTPAVASRLTIASAVATAKAIEFIGVKPEIKWPNDILINRKKVCGILLELAAQPDRIDYVVIGVGINANFDIRNLPGESRNFATSLLTETGKRIDRAQFVAYLLSAFEKEYYRIDAGDWNSTKSDWLSRCMMLGKQISLGAHNGEITGKFIGIDDSGALLLESFYGEVKSYTAGDVTVKK
jgi:BirA family biotin operon repressor/biotin-[acetyl-CoA-carboxylase] ligase